MRRKLLSKNILKKENKMYKTYLKPKAVKDLDKIPNKYFINIKKKIESLSENPRATGSLKLTNQEIYRIRVGVYRIIYEINDTKQEITISRVRHRKDIYK